MPETTVTIDPELHARVADLVRTTGAFEDVEEYVNFVLAELFGGADRQAEDEAERDALGERLKHLGYM